MFIGYKNYNDDVNRVRGGHMERIGIRIMVLATVFLFLLSSGCFESEDSEESEELEDSDGDGHPDTEDAFPNDSSEWSDSDGDGVGDNGDTFPNDSSETDDTDGDGTGDNADTDDDNDGYTDTEEINAGTDPLDPTDYPDTIPPYSDTIPPTVTSTTPADGTIDVPIQPMITITFSEPMYQSTTVHEGLLFEPYGVSEYDASTEWTDNKTVRIINLKGFEFDTTYTVSIDYVYLGNIKDEAGNYLEIGYNWLFTIRPVNVDILSSTVYHKSGDDYTYIYGEVKNQESYNLEDVTLNITCYDINHNVVRTETAYAKPDSLLFMWEGLIMKPKEIAPFAISVGDKDGIITSVDIEPTSATIADEQEYDGLDVISHDGSYDTFWGEYTVSGEVKNNGDQQTEYVTVLATFYDSSGKVIGVKDAFTEPSDIGVGQTATFEVTIYDDECDTASIESYSLIIHD